MIHFVRSISIFTLCIISLSCCVVTPRAVVTEDRKIPSKEKDIKIMQKKDEHDPYVVKKVLDNGLTVLVRPVHTIPKVCIQIWYNVGSKDERDGEKGIAHLIEHMLFKGTEKLSESDINLTIQKLSGRCNAFTASDYTGYLFDMPTHHWEKVLPVVADCMVNAAFKDEHLNSEMKAVIQELKMVKDQHLRSLAYDLMGLMFAGHPYHYPLIGYKKDLWNVRGADLKAFYQKHYAPNNATLVVAGDVDPERVFELAQKFFGKIKPNKAYKKENFHLNEDIVARSLSVYRDVKLPTVLRAFKTPGARKKMSHVLDIAALALGNGKGSRLHKKLVDDLQLATAVTVINWKMFDHGIFFVYFEPKKISDIDKIESIIFDEIKDIASKGLTERELLRATRKAQMAYYAKLENIGSQATSIGNSFLATGDEEYAFTYLDVPLAQIQKDLKQLFTDYFRKTVVHRGAVLPLPEQEKERWAKLQLDSDKVDNEIMSARVRETKVEEPRYTQSVKIEEPGVFEFPKAKQFTLSNGVKVLFHNNDNTPKINLLLSLKVKSYYDPDDKQGLCNFVADMLLEGTQNYSAAELADEIETRGMSFRIVPGAIAVSMHSQDFQKGLELLEEILDRAIFDKGEIEKVREQIYADIKQFWDTPLRFSNQIIDEHVYAGHPYSKNPLGTRETIKKITQKDLKTFYKKYFSPYGARLAVVGDLRGYDVPAILEKWLGVWKGPEVQDVQFPQLAQSTAEKIDHYINRDQVVLCFAGLSVDRKHEDYEKLWLFDQIFGGGVLHAMGSRLVQLREQSGLFYTIGGALAQGASEQPGKVIVKTLVSLDRLQEAEDVIKKTIDESVNSITDEEFMQARLAITNSLVNNFESNAKIAGAFLFLDKYDLPADYFDNRAIELKKITVADMQEAVKKVLSSKKMLTVRVGRVGKKERGQV